MVNGDWQYFDNDKGLDGDGYEGFYPSSNFGGQP